MKPRPQCLVLLLLFCAGLHQAVAAQQTAIFNSIQKLTNSETLLTLTATNTNGLRYRIEAATNVQNWNSLLTLQSTGVNRHADSAAPYLASRYYRAIEVPASAVTGDHLLTTNGEVIIHPMFHATVFMTWNDIAIYNDPDDNSSYLGTYIGLPQADLVLVSHDHGDHMSATQVQAIRKATTVIIAPPAVYNNSSWSALRTITTVLTNGMSTNVWGLTVEAVPSYNTNNNNHPRGAYNGYVVTMGGKRVYFAGDTSNIPEMRALPNIDVAFIPMNLPFTMGVSDAVNAVRAFRPKVVYPYHYQPSTPPADVNLFKRLVGTDLGIEVRLRKIY